MWPYTAGFGQSALEAATDQFPQRVATERRRNDEADTVYYVPERFWGRFRRDITLPEGVEGEQIGSDVEEGLLEVTVRDCATTPGPSHIDGKSKRGR